jgi:hypothetical protein
LQQKGQTLVKLILALALLIGLTAQCTPSSPTPPSPTRASATATPANDTEAIRQLLTTECDAVVHQNIDDLQSIWASDGVITDANHTSDNANDDQVWKKWEAIRDRYINLVFPSNPAFCEHPNLNVHFALPDATATTDVKIGVTNCAGCNAWKLTKGQNGWKITQLTYNLTAQLCLQFESNQRNTEPVFGKNRFGISL